MNNVGTLIAMLGACLCAGVVIGLLIGPATERITAAHTRGFIEGAASTAEQRREERRMRRELHPSDRIMLKTVEGWITPRGWVARSAWKEKMVYVFENAAMAEEFDRIGIIVPHSRVPYELIEDSVTDEQVEDLLGRIASVFSQRDFPA